MASSAKKKKKCSVSWSSSIQTEFPFAASCKSTVSDYKHKFHCTICDRPFSLGGGGADDVRRHGETDTHKKNKRDLASKFVFFVFLDK